jgi:hydrogenase expression/formation protein HypE
VAAIVNEVVAGTGLGIEVNEDAVPIAEKVRSVAEILGLNPLEVANEGVAVCVVAPSAEERALSLLREHSRGREAAVIGRVVTDHAGKVVLETTIGGKRILDFPRGLLLPRIC